jgi:hypothetical protein
LHQQGVKMKINSTIQQPHMHTRAKELAAFSIYLFSSSEDEHLVNKLGHVLVTCAITLNSEATAKNLMMTFSLQKACVGGCNSLLSELEPVVGHKLAQ